MENTHDVKVGRKSYLSVTGVVADGISLVLFVYLKKPGVGLDNYGIFRQPLSLFVDFCEDSGEYCEIVLSAAQIASEKEVDVFPNPTNGSLNVSVENEELRIIRVYNVLGVMKAEFLSTIILI